MHKYRNVRISEENWVKLKQRALDERVTLRELVERAAHLYIDSDDELRQAQLHSRQYWKAKQDKVAALTPRELSYDPEAS